MKPFPILLAVVSLCGAIFVISWMSQPPTAETPLVDEAGRASANPFTIPETGPYPKAVLETESFDFGKMILGETDSHAFVIRNAGDAPLKLHKGQIACKCTIPDIPEEAIAPGESAEVVMEWKPLASTESFDKWAIIWTNDPEHEKLTITITGEVRQLVSVRPPLPWTINNVNETGETEFRGGVASGVDSFKILSVEPSDEWLSAEIVDMSAAELEDFGSGYASGYVVEGKIRPEMSVGRFEGSLILHTDLGDDHTVTISVVGTRPGPFSILGQAWYGADMSVQMGTVPVGEGKTVTLSLFTNREDEPIVIESFTADPDVVTLTLEPDDSFPSPVKEKYLLTFSLSPDTPVGRYVDDDRIDMRLETNREAMAELNLSANAIVE